MYLRLSVTDRCQYHCRYCRQLGETPDPAGRPLPLPDLARLALAIHAATPLSKVRFTGGEPLLRAGLPELVADLRAALPAPMTELCLTTNGARLAPLAEPLRRAGVDRINMSLDSVDPERFHRYTGRDDLAQVTAGIVAAQHAGFPHIKLNTVLMRSEVAAGGLSGLLRFAAHHHAELRFIELMPLGHARPLYETEYVSAAEALERLKEVATFEAVIGQDGTAERHRFRLDDLPVVVGFITPVSHPFCDTCDRLRLDSRGRLHACLRREEGTPLADLLNPPESPRLHEAITRVISHKCHPETEWSRVPMTLLGG